MKKILSIFMVAVLSLNLLYQPCEAMMTLQSTTNYQQQQQQLLDNHNQDKTNCTRKLLNLAKTALKAFLFMAYTVVVFYFGSVGGFISGCRIGWDDAVTAITKKNPHVNKEDYPFKAIFFLGPGAADGLE